MVNTMVFTHLPSSMMLALVPLMPTFGWAVALLLVRFSISHMDVPCRQAYTLSVVASEERSAAAGVTAVARSVGSAISPLLAAKMIGVASLSGMPFFLGGGIKAIYDLLLLREFGKVKPSEAEKDK
jgi:MFS family permease